MRRWGRGAIRQICSRDSERGEDQGWVVGLGGWRRKYSRDSRRQRERDRERGRERERKREREVK